MIRVRFVNDVKLAMINHMRMVPTRECGGFLYGRIVKEKNDIICEVDAIYYEDKLGTDSTFKFNLSYIANAKTVLRHLKSQVLLGTYHSHGIYPAELSDVDRQELQQFFGKNKITLVYSPKYSKIVCEYLDENGISHRVKVGTK